MNITEIKNTFEKVYNGATNFMTPTVINYRKRGGYLFELSEGRAMFNDGMMYGVTVLRNEGGEFKSAHALSMLFDSELDADEYIDSFTGYKEKAGFGTELEVVRNNKVVFMGTRDSVDKWIAAGRPSSAIFVEEVLRS